MHLQLNVLVVTSGNVMMDSTALMTTSAVMAMKTAWTEATRTPAVSFLSSGNIPVTMMNNQISKVSGLHSHGVIRQYSFVIGVLLPLHYMASQNIYLTGWHVVKRSVFH